MKRFFKIFIPLFILGVATYQFRSALNEKFLPALENQFENAKSYILPATPCLEPIPYTLGTFAPQFNISKTYFLSALTEAEGIWEKSAGLDLFVYIPESSSNILKINLIYDYRQQATSKLASLGITVEDNKASYETLKTKFTELKIDYEKEKGVFNARVAAFNERQEAYEAEVNYWNKKGGAPEEEYNKLEKEQTALKAESRELQKMQTHINNTADEINALVVALNRLIATLNLSVEKYNTTNVSRGESFEEGVYHKDATGEGIDIYEFSSRDKLVRVLAHELGHALGLEHVDDSKAIMYKLNQSSSTTLSTADIEALKARCGVE